MRIDSLQERKLELDIELQKRALAQPIPSNWKNPSALIPAVTALISVVGLVIQGTTASYSAKTAELDRKTNELKIEQLNKEIAAKSAQAQQLTQQIAQAQTENQKLGEQQRVVVAQIDTAKKEVQAVADRNGTAKEAAEKLRMFDCPIWPFCK